MSYVIVQPDNLTNARTGQPNRNALLPYFPGASIASAETNFFGAAFPLLFNPISATSVTPQNAVTAAGQEALILVFGRTLHSVQVGGTFTATVAVEVTNDMTLTNWKQLDTFTAADLRQYTGVYYAMRIKITAYTSGSPAVSVVSQR